MPPKLQHVSRPTLLRVGLVLAGLMVMERNWLEVFPWARWGGNDNLPPFAVDQTFMPTELLLKEVHCSWSPTWHHLWGALDTLRAWFCPCHGLPYRRRCGQGPIRHAGVPEP